MSSVEISPAGATTMGRWVPVGVLAVAFAVRLGLVLRGGGLFGVDGYDGSVYYAAAVGLGHGLLPYRDFLLLHPPGVVLALLPFAALGRLVGDPDAFALARLTWIGLGAVNAFLVTRLLRRHGTWPALAAGLLYAVFVPAIYTEHSTSLEAIGSVCLLGAVGLVTRTGAGGPACRRALLGAGLLLGVSSSTKIWGVAVALAVVVWSARTSGVRRALLVLVGAAGGAVLVCLPFFAAAPTAMWRMVVADQLGRRRVPGGLATRLVDVAGLSSLHVSPATTLPLLGLAALIGLVVTVLAITDPLGRLAWLLLAVTTGLLLTTPSWSLHYAGLAAPPAMLVVGVALAGLRERLPRRRTVTTVVVAAVLTAYAATTLSTLSFGRPFPGATLRPSLTAAHGCVTSDDPTVLIESGALARNLDAGCRLVVDLGGYSYDLRPGVDLQVGRPENGQWQRYVRRYLGSGDLTVIARFRTAPGYSPATRQAIAGWPVVATVGPYRVQRPAPPTLATPR